MSEAVLTIGNSSSLDNRNPKELLRGQRILEFPVEVIYLMITISTTIKLLLQTKCRRYCRYNLCDSCLSHTHHDIVLLSMYLQSCRDFDVVNVVVFVWVWSRPTTERRHGGRDAQMCSRRNISHISSISPCLLRKRGKMECEAYLRNISKKPNAIHQAAPIRPPVRRQVE